MKYKTMFIDAPIIKTKISGFPMREINGLQFSKDIEAAVLEKEQEGYDLFSMNAVHSGKPKEGITAHGITTGMILTFKKSN
ncbi:MAG: hypothetical protein AAFZ15_19005 [Bacteroidota bacterium]